MTPILKYISKLIPQRFLDENTSPEKVLIVDCNFSGDVLMDSVAWRAVSDNLDIKADCLTYEVSRPVAERNPYINRVFGVSKSFLNQLRVALRLRRENYDAVIHLNTSLKVNFLCFIIGRRFRIGYDYKHRGCFLNIKVPISRRTYCNNYRVDEVCELFTQSFGWDIGKREMIFNIPQYGKPLFVLCTTTRNTRHLRMWDKWVELGKELIKRHNATLVFTGLPGDKDYILSMVSELKQAHYRETSLNELAGLMRECDLCISVNTFSMHLAISQNTPLVALIGGTPSIVVLPKNNPKVRYVEDPNLSFSQYDPAINEITVEQVVEQIQCLYPNL